MFRSPNVPLLSLVVLLGLIGCGGNRSEAEGDGQTVKVPGDSVRLEDTLSNPPPSDSVRTQ